MTSPERISIRNKLKKVYMSPMSHTLFCHAAASFIRHTRRMCSNVCYWLVSYHFRWYIDKEIGVSIKKGTKKKLVLKIKNVVKHLFKLHVSKLIVGTAALCQVFNFEISSFPSHRCQNKTLFGKVFIDDKMVCKENVCFC